MSSAQKSSRESKMRWVKENPDKIKEYAKNSDWAKNNRDKINKRVRDNNRGVESLCEIRNKHLEDMKNDPESLSPEFLNTIQNLGCEKSESLKSLPFSETLK